MMKRIKLPTSFSTLPSVITEELSSWLESRHGRASGMWIDSWNCLIAKCGRLTAYCTRNVCDLFLWACKFFDICTLTRIYRNAFLMNYAIDRPLFSADDLDVSSSPPADNLLMKCKLDPLNRSLKESDSTRSCLALERFDHHPVWFFHSSFALPLPQHSLLSVRLIGILRLLFEPPRF